MGDVYRHWPGKTITEYDDHLFCMITMNHHPLHTNAWFAAERVRAGAQRGGGEPGVSLALGMSVPDVSGSAIANLEVEPLTTLTRRSTATLSMPRPASSARSNRDPGPDRGVATVETKAFNQRGRGRLLLPSQGDGMEAQTRRPPGVAPMATTSGTSEPSAGRLASVRRAALAWGETHRRALPWRQTRDPWAVLVSEVMLQQTQVPRVVEPFERFLGRFPTAAACAEAPMAPGAARLGRLGLPPSGSVPPPGGHRHRGTLRGPRAVGAGPARGAARCRSVHRPGGPGVRLRARHRGGGDDVLRVLTRAVAPAARSGHPRRRRWPTGWCPGVEPGPSTRRCSISGRPTAPPDTGAVRAVRCDGAASGLGPAGRLRTPRGVGAGRPAVRCRSPGPIARAGAAWWPPSGGVPSDRRSWRPRPAGPMTPPVPCGPATGSLRTAWLVSNRMAGWPSPDARRCAGRPPRERRRGRRPACRRRPGKGEQGKARPAASPT